MLTFVNAGGENVADLGYLHATVWHQTYKGLASDSFLERFTPERRTAVFRKVIETSTEHFIIAYLEGKPVGFVICKSTEQAGIGEVCAIYLLREVQRKGYGREMMDYAINLLQNEGCRELILWVLEKNTQARGFYEKYGFEPDGGRQEIDLGNKLTELRYHYKPKGNLK